MNERYAVEPDACSNSAELRFLLERFGPFAGRYIAAIPASWANQVKEEIRNWTPVESMRASILLQRAVEKKVLVRLKDIPFDASRNWLFNAENAASKRHLESIIVNRSNAGKYFCVDQINLPPTADETVYATPEEFVRVSSCLIMVSPELIFIDPYLDPCVQDRISILDALFRFIAMSGVRKITFLTSAARVRSTAEEIEFSLKQVAKKAGLSKIQTNFILADDRFSSDKLHARYLLSVRGAIRFDQGFQELRKRKVDVSVVGASVHSELVSKFMEDKNDFVISKTVTFSSI